MTFRQFAVTGISITPVEPLVEKNLFRQRDRAPGRIPDFEDVRARLPIPVLPEDTQWESIYWTAWDLFWRSLKQPADGSGLSAGYNQPKPGRYIEMGRSGLVASLAGYIPGSFSLVEFLDNFYATQQDDGFICREIDPASGKAVHDAYNPNSTGPNLLAWTEWRHFRLTGDKDRVASVFWPLLALHRWSRANRTWRNGLYWTTAYASGLLNQPRVSGSRYHHNHWAWIDASAQAVINCAMLERMASVLGEQEQVNDVTSEREKLVRVINAEMWNEELHFYQDIGPDNGFSDVKSIAAYWTLLNPYLVPKERLIPFVQHLRDAWSFHTENVVPSLSADADAYNGRTGNGWRGAVWPGLTYMVLRGLHANEQTNLAHKLAVNQLEVVRRVYEDTGFFWENYAPEEAVPGDPSEVDNSGTTASAIIPMVLESVLGLAVDWPLRQITWRRLLDRQQSYGVRNLPLGNEGTIDLVGDDESVHVRTDAPITLAIYGDHETIQVAVPAGDFNISFK